MAPEDLVRTLIRATAGIAILTPLALVVFRGTADLDPTIQLVLGVGLSLITITRLVNLVK